MKKISILTFFVVILPLSHAFAIQSKHILLQPFAFSESNCDKIFPYQSGFWFQISENTVWLEFPEKTSYKLKKSGNTWSYSEESVTAGRRRSFLLFFEQDGDSFIASEKITQNELEITEQCAGRYFLNNGRIE